MVEVQSQPVIYNHLQRIVGEFPIPVCFQSVPGSKLRHIHDGYVPPATCPKYPNKRASRTQNCTMASATKFPTVAINIIVYRNDK